jgi:Haloacid dehalogenase-like hydrolase
MDMDGVLVREEHAIPGAAEFLERLRDLGLPFLVLTNNSIYTQRDLAACKRPRRRGERDLDVRPRHREVPAGSAAARVRVRRR